MLSSRTNLMLLLAIILWITPGCVNLYPANPKNDNPTLISNTIPKDVDLKSAEKLSCTVKVSAVSGITDNLIRVKKNFNYSQLNDNTLIVIGVTMPISPLNVMTSEATCAPIIYFQEDLSDGKKSQTITIIGT